MPFPSFCHLATRPHPFLPLCSYQYLAPSRVVCTNNSATIVWGHKIVGGLWSDKRRQHSTAERKRGRERDVEISVLNRPCARARAQFLWGKSGMRKRAAGLTCALAQIFFLGAQAFSPLGEKFLRTLFAVRRKKPLFSLKRPSFLRPKRQDADCCRLL